MTSSLLVSFPCALVHLWCLNISSGPPRKSIASWNRLKNQKLYYWNYICIYDDMTVHYTRQDHFVQFLGDQIVLNLESPSSTDHLYVLHFIWSFERVWKGVTTIGDDDTLVCMCGEFWLFFKRCLSTTVHSVGCELINRHWSNSPALYYPPSL